MIDEIYQTLLYDLEEEAFKPILFEKSSIKNYEEAFKEKLGCEELTVFKQFIGDKEYSIFSPVGDNFPKYRLFFNESKFLDKGQMHCYKQVLITSSDIKEGLEREDLERIKGALNKVLVYSANNNDTELHRILATYNPDCSNEIFIIYENFDLQFKTVYGFPTGTLIIEDQKTKKRDIKEMLTLYPKDCVDCMDTVGRTFIKKSREIKEDVSYGN